MKKCPERASLFRGILIFAIYCGSFFLPVFLSRLFQHIGKHFLRRDHIAVQDLTFPESREVFGNVRSCTAM